MIQTFTQNDLVRHLYTEESPQQGEAVDAFISSSEKMTHNFDDFCLIKAALNHIHLEPSPESVNSILCYSALSKFTQKKK
jgi:hypothetical protein